MLDAVFIREATDADADAVNSLIIDVFKAKVAPDYSDEGVRYFLNLCTPGEVRKAISTVDPVYVAVHEERIVGTLWVRNLEHISRFFVSLEYQNKGIARMLFRHFLTDIRTRHSEVGRIQVNSSPTAVGAYEKLGFERTGPEKVKNGMRFIPMVFKVGVV